MLLQAELWSELHRRLGDDPPARRTEVVQRLKVMRDECTAELRQFRPAVERALTIAEHPGAS
ncbi:MAG: hypothetical protein GTO22_06060 [Gemmatimonadales bacterium]|nr:hypothetical protein [Gemmatimonadales bacterium]